MYSVVQGKTLTNVIHLSYVLPFQSQLCQCSLSVPDDTCHTSHQIQSLGDPEPIHGGLRTSRAWESAPGEPGSLALSATKGLLGSVQVDQPCSIRGGTLMSPHSCDETDRCLITNNTAIIYQATSEHLSHYEGRKTNRRQSGLQFSQAGLYLRSPASLIHKA